MLRSSLTPPVEFPPKKHAIADDVVPGPMSLQDGAGCHGHEMHPQKFVRLVGCHESSPPSRPDTHRLH